MTIALAQPQLDAIAAACRLHHVARLHVFGSVLRPDYRPGESDIDLLVEFEDLQPTELVEAYFGLEQQLTESVGSSIDLVMATAVRNPIVRADIDASKQLIYAA
jgi:predicted nucleotidyltransferase